MAQLTKMMTMLLTKAPAGEPTGGLDKDRCRGRGGRCEQKINPLAKLLKIYNKVVMNNKATCWELEANAATRPPGWSFKNSIDQGQ